jgi:hypothetical protein
LLPAPGGGRPGKGKGRRRPPPRRRRPPSPPQMQLQLTTTRLLQQQQRRPRPPHLVLLMSQLKKPPPPPLQRSGRAGEGGRRRGRGRVRGGPSTHPRGREGLSLSRTRIPLLNARAATEGADGTVVAGAVHHPSPHPPSPLARSSIRRSTSSQWALCTRPTTIEQTTRKSLETMQKRYILFLTLRQLPLLGGDVWPGRPPAVPHAPLLTRNIRPPPFPPDAELTSPRRRWGGP